MPLIDLGPLGLGSHRDWREGLPFMATRRLTLRELRRGDAPALMRLTQMPEIARHTWPPPSTLAAFEQFIEWARSTRAGGGHAAFAVVPRRQTEMAGLFDLRSLEPGFLRAELSFILDPVLWGTGAFLDAGRLVCEFAFTAVGIHRIEARAEVDNDRANAALKKLGAVREGRLRRSFERDGTQVDQYLWSLVNGLDTAGI
jgi:RimJ/RimL family protein N-acetyltransferase